MSTGPEGVAPSDREIFFGTFCLRPAAHLLLDGNAPVHLGGRALDLLMVLIEHAGDVVTGTVLASSNVASVELRIGGYSLNSTKTDVGHFEWSFTVPQLPFYAPHDFALQIIARNTAGVAATTSVQMSVR